MEFYLGSYKEENMTMVTNTDPIDTNNNSRNMTNIRIYAIEEHELDYKRQLKLIEFNV
jgi:hypothetical protein